MTVTVFHHVVSVGTRPPLCLILSLFLARSSIIDRFPFYIRSVWAKRSTESSV